ncbi:MAG: 4-(cytidine 5'-diphospho)-2-C-methyl-D-erythritol kinase [Firmicutes bacterium]|nr:4-(cytidine 5'-diphospho)-2-C-methyl-D-erythritol kinase [Bacillota bacterium]
MKGQNGKILGSAQSIELKARAKINLSLDVTGKRQDGYHNIKTIMQTIELYDRVIISVAEKGIEVKCDCGKVPPGKGNIAYKAAELFIERYGIDRGVKIIIEKNIPVASGLAGGSADAAAVIKGMDRLFECGADEEDLIYLGRNIGADVPFCIKGGTVLAEGIGDVLTELVQLPRTYILIVSPDIEVSTRWVYESLNIRKISKRPDMELLLESIRKGRIDLLAKNMVNVLETVTASKYTVINIIKEKLKELGALGSIMSGSGPSVFGIFTDKQTADKAYKMLMYNGWNVFTTETF